MTLHIGSRPEGTLGFSSIDSQVHEDLRDEGHALRPEESSWVAWPDLAQRLLKPEPLFASTCLPDVAPERVLRTPRLGVRARLSRRSLSPRSRGTAPEATLRTLDGVGAAVVADSSEAHRVDVRTLLANECHQTRRLA
jgi:hypothetical protein